MWRECRGASGPPVCEWISSWSTENVFLCLDSNYDDGKMQEVLVLGDQLLCLDSNYDDGKMTAMVLHDQPQLCLDSNYDDGKICA